MKKFIILLFLVISIFSLTSCEVSGSRQDIYTTQENANNIQENQPTPSLGGQCAGGHRHGIGLFGVRGCGK